MAERTRKFWQIHLSTAVLSMLVASVLLGLNLVDRDIRSEYQAWYAKDYDALRTWGWPWRFGTSGIVNANAPWIRELKSPVAADCYHFALWDEGTRNTALMNGVVCVSLTFAFAALCEFSIRLKMKRRARRVDAVQAPSV